VPVGRSRLHAESCSNTGKKYFSTFMSLTQTPPVVVTCDTLSTRNITKTDWQM